MRPRARAAGRPQRQAKDREQPHDGRAQQVAHDEHAPLEQPVGDGALRPGDRVMICPRLLHTDPRWWSAPDTFDPDRWLRPRTPEATAAYLPFGTGPRACPAARLATAQLVDGLAALWADATIELDDVADVGERLAALAYPARCRGSVRLPA